MLIVEKKTNQKITVSFSSSVGDEGLKNIKNYIEFLEKNKISSSKKVSKALVAKIADEITASGWKKMSTTHNL